jgi:hypothetical protein
MEREGGWQPFLRQGKLKVAATWGIDAAYTV